MSMASKRPSQILLLLFPLFILSQFTFSHGAGGIVTYWGQHRDEGELDVACATGKYEIINIAFLSEFGAGRTPKINLAGHCSEDWGVPCTKYASQIATCQSLGVKLFLSLGGDSLNYSLSSADDAKQVAYYLWTSYLGGQTGSGGLLGNVVLDGIDFDIEHGGNMYWDVLAEELHSYSQQKKFYLSAAPQCPIPDYYLDKAIKTGVFDYLFVQFYNNPDCMYSTTSNTEKLFSSWDTWTTSFDVTKVYLGLPAAVEAARSGGYIPVDVLNQQVIPYVSTASKYGGVMLWSRYYDVVTSYSDNIILTSLRASKVHLAMVDAVLYASQALYRLLS